MVTVYASLGIVLITTFVLLLRLAPLWKRRYRGVDAYYFLLTAEEFKKQKRIPIKLPSYYLLDIEEQWYPPGFSVFLGLFPQKTLTKFYWLLTPLLDTVNLVILLIFTYFQTFSLECIFVAGLIYALTPVLAAESTTLTSRALGNLFLTGEILSFVFYSQYQSALYIALALIFGFLIFATHKMTLQFLVFLYFSLALVFQSLIPLLILVSSFLLSLVLLRGYFVKILKGHYDIILFWHRNWQNLGNHQVYASPLYGNRAKTTKKKMGQVERSSFERIKATIAAKNKTIYFLLRGIIGKSSNPFILLVLLYGFWAFTSLGVAQSVVFWWAALAFLWMFLTIFIPYLRLFGEGFKYMRSAAFPTAFIVSQFLVLGNLPVLGTVLGFIVFSVAAVRSFLLLRELHQGGRVGASLDEDLLKAFEHIKDHPEIDYIACFSVDIADALVYHCRRHVLWGTHHDSFNEKVVDFYPVLRKPLSWFQERYGIQYVLLDTGYVKPQDLNLSEESRVFSSGKYLLYGLAPDLTHVSKGGKN